MAVNYKHKASYTDIIKFVRDNGKNASAHHSQGDVELLTFYADNVTRQEVIETENNVRALMRSTGNTAGVVYISLFNLDARMTSPSVVKRIVSELESR